MIQNKYRIKEGCKQAERKPKKVPPSGFMSFAMSEGDVMGAAAYFKTRNKYKKKRRK